MLSVFHSISTLAYSTAAVSTHRGRECGEFLRHVTWSILEGEDVRPCDRFQAAASLCSD